MSVRRVKTGVNGLDELIQGGFPEGYTILVTGSPGTAKTILGLQFLVEGALKGEPGIYFTFEESKKKIFEQAEQFGWDLEKLEKKGKLIVNSLCDITISEILDTLSDETKKIKAKRLVVDSLSTLVKSAKRPASKLQMEVYKLTKDKYSSHLADPSERITHDDVFHIIQDINTFGLTTLLITEAPKDGNYYSRDTVSEFICDGVVELKAMEGIGKRTLGINKLRATKHDIIPFDMQITDSGVAII